MYATFSCYDSFLSFCIYDDNTYFKGNSVPSPSRSGALRSRMVLAGAQAAALADPQWLGGRDSSLALLAFYHRAPTYVKEAKNVLFTQNPQFLRVWPSNYGWIKYYNL